MLHPSSRARLGPMTVLPLTLAISALCAARLAMPGLPPTATGRLLDLLQTIGPTAAILPALFLHLQREASESRWAALAATLAWALASAQAGAAATAATEAIAAPLLVGTFLLAHHAHRQEHSGWLALAGAAGGLCLLVTYAPGATPHHTLLPALGAVALFAVFGERRHLRPPRFDATSGRLVAALGGLAAVLLLHGIFAPGPLLPAWSSRLSLSPRRLAALVLGPGHLLVSAPWLPLALAGLYRHVRSGSRRSLLYVTLGVLATTMGGLVLAAPGDPPPTPVDLLPLLPFLAGPLARALSWLRERPGPRGPLGAGTATGLLLAPVLANTWHTVAPRILASESLGVRPLASSLLTLAALLAPALLFPGRASSPGRLKAFGACLATGGIVAAILVLTGR